VKRRMLCRMLAVPPLGFVLRGVAQPTGAYRVARVSMNQAATASPVLAAFRAGMAELGYVEGKNLIIAVLANPDRPGAPRELQAARDNADQLGLSISQALCRARTR
jgi:hypothetical protein